MAGVGALLAEARAVGLDVRALEDGLVVRGPARHESLARRLLAHKPAVMRVLAEEAAEVAWRAATMRQRLPGSGAIPFLVARPAPPSPGCCLSCGDPLPDGCAVRCVPCARAARLVSYGTREEVTQ